MKPPFVVQTLLLFIIYSLINTSRSQAQTFFGVSANPVDNGSVVTNTVSVTPPATMVAGDLVVIYAHYDDNATLTITSANSGGQSWNTETAVNNGTQSFAIFWCEYNGTWPSNPIVSGGSGGSDPLTAVMYVFRPSNASKVWGIHIGATNTTDNSSPYTINGVTTTVPNTVTMAFWGSSDDNTWGTFTGTGWSKGSLSTQYRNTGGGQQSHTAAYNIQPTAATIGNVAQSQATLGDDYTNKSIVTWAEFTPPSNDLCANATPITPSSTACTPVNGSLLGSSYTAFTGACTTNPDVWYSFTASAISDTIRISGLTNGYVQLMTAASCGGTLSQIGSCSNASGTNGAVFTGLTVGNQYLVRVYSNTGASSDFTICIKDIPPATLDYGKSYANISKLSGGGTIAVGDTLEMRATLVVRTLAVDSLSFIDTLPKGVRYVPGSIAIKTNEGKIYRWDNTSSVVPPVAFTDNFDTDAGRIYNSAGDSVIRINIGVSSSGTARGKLRHNTYPRIGSATTGNSIIMATYRVVVDTTFGAILNLGGGYFTARDSATATMRTLSFGPRSAIVYQTPGLCPNALSPSNAIADEYGGTFGNAVISGFSLPMKDRGPSSNVPGYTYSPFAASAPNDYFYGISNNTGAGGAGTYTASTAWPKNSNRRVHQVWDISGDHTGAANLTAGNPACDTTLPASPTNPCGYMLVVNSSYKTDTAFQYNISNLCPNTYFEISFWVKNICAKCGADSLGRWASSTGYLPTGTNDSSGVRPNLAIDINGIDYYTTGQIQYVGTDLAQTLQDNANVWVKRGFTYLTGSTPGTLTMSIRNTAPGGGGNDWALDDINVATCFPNMSYSPSLTPNVCIANPLTIYDTVRSYFNNYNYYKWQRSTNGGSSWTDVTSAFGPVTPVLNGSLYEYVSSYTIAPAQATLANSGDLYRLITATTNSNLSSSDCISTDFSSIVTLNVIDCNPVLTTTLLSFNGKLIGDKASLSWITSKEDEQITYIIERSMNQTTFTEAGRITGFNNNVSVKNYYSFQDPLSINQKTWYRIVMVNPDGKKQYSRIILLDNSHPDFGFGNVINPFINNLYFDIVSKENSKIDVTLIDMSGKPVIHKSYVISSGTNSLSIDNTAGIAQGVYTLKIENKGSIISKRVVKRN